MVRKTVFAIRLFVEIGIKEASKEARRTRSAGGQKYQIPEEVPKMTRRTPEEGPKKARSEACQKANRPEVRHARRPVGHVLAT